MLCQYVLYVCHYFVLACHYFILARYSFRVSYYFVESFRYEVHTLGVMSLCRHHMIKVIDKQWYFLHLNLDSALTSYHNQGNHRKSQQSFGNTELSWSQQAWKFWKFVKGVSLQSRETYPRWNLNIAWHFACSAAFQVVKSSYGFSTHISWLIISQALRIKTMTRTDRMIMKPEPDYQERKMETTVSTLVKRSSAYHLSSGLNIGSIVISNNFLHSYFPWDTYGICAHVILCCQSNFSTYNIQ